MLIFDEMLKNADNLRQKCNYGRANIVSLAELNEADYLTTQ